MALARGYKLRPSERGRNFMNAKASAISLEWLADSLSGSQSKLVVDGTGLEGIYEFDLDVEIDGDEAMDPKVPASDASRHVREAFLSALGLKLQGVKKESVEVLVIDQVTRPEAN